MNTITSNCIKTAHEALPADCAARLHSPTGDPLRRRDPRGRSPRRRILLLDDDLDGGNISLGTGDGRGAEFVLMFPKAALAR